VKLHAAGPSAANTITGYGEDHVLVNGQRRDSSVIITADRVLAWEADAFDRLRSEDFERLAKLGVEIVLLGTGPRQRFPHPRLTAPLAAAGAAFDLLTRRLRAVSQVTVVAAPLDQAKS